MRYLYIARAGDFIKVGSSTQPRARMAELTQKRSDLKRPKSLTEPAVLIHAIPSGDGDEGRLHRALAQFRVIGEWYRSECLATPEVLTILGKEAKLGPELNATISAMIPGSVWTALKICAVKNKRKMADVLTEALRRYLGMERAA